MYVPESDVTAELGKMRKTMTVAVFGFGVEKTAKKDEFSVSLSNRRDEAGPVLFDPGALLCSGGWRQKPHETETVRVKKGLSKVRRVKETAKVAGYTVGRCCWWWRVLGVTLSVIARSACN